MSTIKDKKKILSIFSLIGIFVAATCLPTSQATAEEKKYKIINYVSKVERLPVGDKEGHNLGFYERRGIVIYEDGEMAAFIGRGTFDLTNLGGTGEGYSLTTYKDGSTEWAKIRFTLVLPPGEKLLPFVEHKGEYIEGTGRFKGIKGSFTCKGPYITPFTPDKTKGDLCMECTETRTLPSR